MKRWMLRGITLLFLLLIAGGALIAYEAHRFLTTPGSETPEEIVFTIQPGATFIRVAWDLKKAGAIRDVPRFQALAEWRGAVGRIKAGEFLINTGWTPGEVLRQITEGKALLYRMSVREGLTWWETARALEEQGFVRYDDFRAVVHDPEFLREHHIPFANAEGFLQPETYLMRKPPAVPDRAQAREVASTMVTMFWKRTEPIWTALPVKDTGTDAGAPLGAMRSPAIRSPLAGETPGKGGNGTSPGNGTAPAGGEIPPESGRNAGAMGGGPVPAPGNGTLGQAAETAVPAGPRSPADIEPQALKRLVILASLVEKETGVPEERARVAGVYANRLRVGMLLQCDPTIIYGVGETFSGEIRRSQINDAKNAYNTYQHPGLPPGPICSFGVEAVRAAAFPEEHAYYYFVATGGGGGHTFSKSLQEHNKAVQQYRARMRGR